MAAMRTCARDWCTAAFPVGRGRKYCSDNCTHGRTWDLRKDIPLTCAREGCDEQFLSNYIGQPRKYCSAECRMAFRRPKIERAATCAAPDCDRPPRPKRNARYCSDRCNMRHRWHIDAEFRDQQLVRVKTERAAKAGRQIVGRLCATCKEPIPDSEFAGRRYCSINCKESARDTEKRRAASRDRYKRDPSAARAESSKRRALKRNSVLVCETSIMDILKSGPCVYCGAPSEDVDHIRPLSQGGVHHESNLVPACMRCNRGKHSQLLTEWDDVRVAHAVKRSPKVRAEWKRLQLGQEAMF